MSNFIDTLLALWTAPLAEDSAEEQFAVLYTDPVVVNGVEFSVAEMAARARMLQSALTDLHAEVLQVVEGDSSLALAFVMRGHHTGDYHGPLGVVPATGNEVEVRTIDVLTLTEGRISRIWVNADDLSMLRQLGALSESP